MPTTTTNSKSAASPSIDDLMDDLYPDQGINHQNTDNNGEATKNKKLANNFDDSSDEEAAVVPTTALIASSKGQNSKKATAAVITFPTTKAPVYADLHSKPPSCCGMTPSSLSGGGVGVGGGASSSSTNKCILSTEASPRTIPFNRGNINKNINSGTTISGITSSWLVVPTLGALRHHTPAPTSSELGRIISTNGSGGGGGVFVSQGAFHMYAPLAGNGVKDHNAANNNNNNNPSSSTGGGGCPFLVCGKCDNPVVRLQGARWLGINTTTRNEEEEQEQDQKRKKNSSSIGTTYGMVVDDPDLYLTVRNLYPDWGKLSTCKLRDYSSSSANYRGHHRQHSTAASKSAPPTKKAMDNFDSSSSDGDDEKKTTTSMTSAAKAPPTKKNIGSFDDDDDDDEHVKHDEPPRNSNNAISHKMTKTMDSAVVVNVAGTDEEVEESADNPFVLVEDSDAAAYCCQCSWFSVVMLGGGGEKEEEQPQSEKCTSTAIRTTLADITLKKHAAEFTSPTGGFISVSIDGKIPSPAPPPTNANNGGGATSSSSSFEKRYNPHKRTRAPLWVCKGHL